MKINFKKIATLGLENSIHWSCKDCGDKIFADRNRVMLKDSLWKKVCDKLSDEICDRCIEKRMGRKITEQDFLKPKIKGKKIILCNKWWLQNKNKKSK